MVQPLSARAPHRLAGVLVFACILLAILALAWWAYYPGLSGAFLFDDLGSLTKLGATGPIHDWPAFWRYITSGTADPTGRPIPLLTFLIDARNWPANPYPFKVTNVILHLINGGLLACVLWWLGRVMYKSRPALDESSDSHWPAIAALFGAGAWLLHPLLVSTTLYIVQREAMLAATFVLIGILGWIASHELLARGHTRHALAGMIFSAWLCTVLAVLSKANGALLPLLLLLVEWIVLSHRPISNCFAARIHKRAVIVFLAIPAALVVAYLLYLLPGAIHSAPGVRGWTVEQRLLTEPRVLADYLRLLVIPHACSSGLFNDAFPISSSLLHPASTLPCIVLILVLIGAGFTLRKRHPAIALALLFYFTAQLMESGWIPLELYFEHRNYLPAMLLFWPIGIMIARLHTPRWLGTAIGIAILLTIAVLTWQRASLWGDAPRQARVWAATNPDSARAQTSAALYDLQSGMPRLAAARLQLAMQKNAKSVQIPINLITAECQLGSVEPKAISAATAAMATDRAGGQVVFNWFNDTLALINERHCHGLGYTTLGHMLDEVATSPLWQKHIALQINLHHMRGTLALAEHHPQRALTEFNMALADMPQPQSALSQAARLGAAGYPELGLEHLAYFQTLKVQRSSSFNMSTIHAWVLQLQHWWPKEIAYLRKSLASNTDNEAHGGASGA